MGASLVANVLIQTRLCVGLGSRYQETGTGTAWWWAVRVVGRGQLSRLVAGEGGPSTYDGQSRWFSILFPRSLSPLRPC